MNRILRILFCFLLLVQFVKAQTAVAPSAGDGTPENPYQIATLENLYWIASDSVNWKSNYIQTADINASQTVSWFGGQGWLPISDVVPYYYYQGTYDGNGYVIDSLFINRPTEDLIGLFKGGGKIINLGITHANITGGSRVGGIVGLGGFLENCYSSGIVNAMSGDAGGLVGRLFSSRSGIVNCFSTAEVNGNDAGGLAAENVEGCILNSYSLGKINGNTAGGLVALGVCSLIMNSYFSGEVNGSEAAGGLIGASSLPGFTINSYWNKDSTGLLTNEYGKGKTTAELKNPLLFSKSPWDSTAWFMDAGFNNGYPYLSWQNPGGTPLPGGIIIAPEVGDGTKENPYQIATLENLYWLAQNPIVCNIGNYFIQVADINAAKTREYGDGEGWVPIGIAALPFAATYYGNGHTLDSLFINRPFEDNQGLFGKTDFFGIIDSIGITNADITGYNNVGTLCGNLSITRIGNCYSTGKVYGSGSNVGGLVGEAITMGFIGNCYSSADVTGGNSVGGLIGSTTRYSIVDQCYSTGAVVGNNATGGLVGTITGFPVPVVTNSFWDSVASGQSTSAGGMGKSTAEMKISYTYSDVGWNPAFWFMDSTFNDGYPYLSWQNPNGTPIPHIAKLNMSKSINFGVVLLDTSKVKSTSILNPGFDTLRIMDIVSSNESFTFTLTKNKIAPSETGVYLYITFTPQDTSKQTGFIVITSNALSSPDTLEVIGSGSTVTAVESEPGLPVSFSISQNYPNPFNPITSIEYSIPKTTFISITVYDLLGRDVEQIVNEVKLPGKYSVKFDGTNLPSGVYFYSIKGGDFHQVRKMILVK